MTSRTAERWPVRFAARWMARIEGVSGHIQLASLALTAFSTFSLLLEQVGLGAYIPYIGTAGLGGLIVFTWAYTELGVWNQVIRDERDMSTNHSHPAQRIDDEFIGRAVVAGVKGRQLTDEERRAIDEELDHGFREYRDGYDLGRLDDEGEGSEMGETV